MGGGEWPLNSLCRLMVLTQAYHHSEEGHWQTCNFGVRPSTKGDCWFMFFAYLKKKKRTILSFLWIVGS